MIKKYNLLLAACCLLLTVFAHAAIANSAVLLDKITAVVNKDVITWSDLYKAMEFDASDEVRAMKDEDRRKFFKESESIFLESLIDMRLQLQAAAKSGISATDDDVSRAIESIKKKHSLTDEAFKDAIAKEGFSIAGYRKKLSEQITISRIVEHEVRSKIIVTEGEIDKYMAENKEIERQSDGFNISHIFLRNADDKKKIEERASEIYNKIQAGGDFSELARQHSEDVSARSGGELGFIRKSDMSKDFLDILLKMKAGDVSEPFWSANGIHIIRLNEKTEIKNKQELKEIARQKLLEEKFRMEYRNWLKGLREKAYVEIKL